MMYTVKDRVTELFQKINRIHREDYYLQTLTEIFMYLDRIFPLWNGAFEDKINSNPSNIHLKYNDKFRCLESTTGKQHHHLQL